MTTSATSKAVKQAVRYLRRHGLEGGRPLNHLEAMMSDRQGAADELAQLIGRAPDHDLAPAVRLARLLGARELADPIAASVLRRPAPLAAKTEAVETLAELGVEVPAAVRDTLATVQGFLGAPDRQRLRAVLELPASWRQPAIEAWLSGGVQEVELLEALLQEQPERTDEIIDQLGESGSPAAAALLQRLAEGGDKERGKRVRRALHRLRAAGVEIEESAPEETFSFALDADPSHARAWSSGVDGSGGRIVWVLAPTARGGEELLEAVLDDTRGLRRAETMAVTRKGFRSHLDRLDENPGILVVQLPVEEAAAALRRAEKMAEREGEELPADWLSWRRGMGEKLLTAAPSEPDDAAAEIATGTSADEGDRQLVQESVELLKDPLFSNWAVLGEAAEEAALAVRRAEKSELVVDDEQRKQQVDQAIAGAARALDGEARARYRSRLETMAYLLERGRREEQARLARHAAVGFTTIDDLYASHPLARAMVQRGVLAAYQGVREREESEEPDSRIVRP